jgi:transcriptional regulator with XRE-family HTH domain
MSNFGSRVAELRDRLGLKQRTLAQRVSLTPSHLNKIEKGVRNPPAVETVLAIVEQVCRKWEEAEELVQLAGYSPEVLHVGGVLAYDSPSLPKSPVSDASYQRLFVTLAKVANLPHPRQEQFIDRIIEFIESEVNKETTNE